MASPDVVQYFGLELTALEEQQLIDTALALASVAFPDWTPRESNTEVVILEQEAAMVANLGYLINQLPNGMAEVLLRLFSVLRDPGQPPATVLRFTLTDTLGHTIPAGTVVRLNLGETVDPLDFITDVDLVIDLGDDEGTVIATSNVATSIANGTAPGETLDLLDAIAYVDSVVIDEVVAGGTEAEDQETFLARAAPTLSRLTSTLVRPEDVETFIAGLTALAVRIKVLDLYNPDEAGAPGDYPGHVTAAVAGAGGAILGATTKSLIRAAVVARMHAGLTFHVIDPAVHTITLAPTVLRQGTAISSEVAANVEAALRAYLNANTWPWSPAILINELIPVIDAAAGVDTVDTITLTVTYPDATPDLVAVDADAPLVGYAPLVTVDTVTVTVTDPA